jgi:hypothetical protein
MFKLALIALLAVVAGTAQAQQCAPRAALEQAVRNYGERQIGFGIDGKSGSYVTVYAARSGAWTFLMTPMDQPQLICIVGVGTQFQHTNGGIVGVLADQSVVNLSYKMNGEWRIDYMNHATGVWEQVSSGYGWEVTHAPDSET